MKVVVLRNPNHKSGKVLADLIGAECRTSGKEVPDYCDVLVRFGSIDKLRDEVKDLVKVEINSAEGIRIAKDRVKLADVMKKAGIRTPYFKKLRWWTKFPIYVYSKDGSECGNGVVLCMSRGDLKWLEMLNFDIGIYSKVVNVAYECRVHVCRYGLGKNDFAVLVYEKVPRNVRHDMFVVRNLAKTGWKFDIRCCGIEYDKLKYVFLKGSVGYKISVEAIKAVKVCGLDFAGVDVAVDDKGKVWVFDINTAPGIKRDETKRFYGKYLKGLIADLKLGSSALRGI